MKLLERTLFPSRISKVVFFIISLSSSVQAQTLLDFNALVKKPGYSLLVKILSETDPMEVFGYKREVWAQVENDYKGNFPKGVDRDSIQILLDDESLSLNKQYVVLVTGTSVFGMKGCYWQLVDSNSVMSRVGSNDRGGFVFGKTIISNKDFKSAIRSANHVEKIRKRMDHELAVYGPPASTSWGFHRLWSGKKSYGEFAEGIYVAEWNASRVNKKSVFIYKNGHVKMLVNHDDETVVKLVTKFMKRNKCLPSELTECVHRVRNVLVGDAKSHGDPKRPMRNIGMNDH